MQERISVLISKVPRLSLWVMTVSYTHLERNYPSLLVNRIYADAFHRESSATGETYPDATKRLLQLFNRKDCPVMMTKLVIATVLSIRKNTSKTMPIRKVIRTVSTIPMTVGVEEILSVPLGNMITRK